MTGIVLQARLDSSRLPGKALLLLDGKPVIYRVMEALNQIPADIRIIACPEDSFSSLKPLADEAGFNILTGPKDDVLERYCLVIRHFSLTRIIRATGDNPFVFADAAAVLNSEAIALNTDYSGYASLPYGAGVESVSASALLRAAEQTLSAYDREHVCPYLYNNPEKFKVHRPAAPEQWIDKEQRTDNKEQRTENREMRITVDTIEDYENAVLLYNALNKEPERYFGTTIIKVYSQLFAEKQRCN